LPATGPAHIRAAAAGGAAPLPDFIVIGAMRSATTTLHRQLASHPEIGMSRAKETDFFIAELNFRRGVDWYRNLFPTGRRVRGESSPNYTKFDIFPGVPGRIRRLLPDCRLIYLVRDPVARALSHYRFSACLGAGRATLEADRHRHIRLTSSYALQIERYLDCFERDRILVLDFDELHRDPPAVLGELGRFIGVPDGWSAHAPRQANASDDLARLPAWYVRLRRSRAADDLRARLAPASAARLRALVARRAPRALPDLAPDLSERLRDELAPDAARFRQLVGMPFPQWCV
jgi:hypothetical protein